MQLRIDNSSEYSSRKFSKVTVIKPEGLQLLLMKVTN